MISEQPVRAAEIFISISGQSSDFLLLKPEYREGWRGSVMIRRDERFGEEEVVKYKRKQ